MTKVILFLTREQRAQKKALRNKDNSTNSSNAQHLTQIAHDIFTSMTNAADALVKNDSPENFQELQKAANSLLTKELTLGDKRMVFCYLKLSLLGDESLLFAAPKMTDSQQLISEQLEGLEIKLEINTWNDDLTNSSLRALHEALPNTRQLAWSDQLFAILAETTLPENGRMRISDNLAGLYGHHLNMFRVNKREEPDWDIVQTATFVLDLTFRTLPLESSKSFL